jgi:host factor-I protein
MSKAAMNLQDSFLNQVRRENTEVRVLLVNGTVLRGHVKGFDNFTLVLNSRNGQHLVYKHAIAQLVNFRNSGPRREGEDGQGKDEAQDSSGGEESMESAPAVTASTAHNEHKPVQESRPRENRPRAVRKDGFNKLDLTGVQLDAEAERAKTSA